MDNDNKSIAIGAAWMVMLRFSVKGISVLSTIILARLLSPDDFGIMALAMSIYAMIELIRAFGFDTALIQNQKARREHYDTAWTMQFIFAVTGSFLLLFISQLVSVFYDDSRIAPVLYIMALIILLSGLTNIGIVEFRKTMNFGKEFKYHLLIKLFGFLTTIPLAWYLRSYWALVIGILITTLTALMLSYMMQAYRPRFCLSAWKDLLSYSSWLFLSNILLFLNQNAQNLILGKTSGNTSLGLLSISNEIATLTTSEIIAPINRAAFPGYSKVSDDMDKLKRLYLNVFSSIGIIAIPSALGIAAIAPIFVPVLLGQQWIDSIPVIQTISLASALGALSTNSGYIYLATGKPKITTMLFGIRILILLPLITLLSVTYGVMGVAYSIAITELIVFPINQFILIKTLNINWTRVINAVYRPAIASTIMAFCVNQYALSKGQLALGVEGISTLIVGISIGVVIFLSILLSLWILSRKPEGTEQMAIRYIARKLAL